jgi:hypothetical protein
MADRRLLLWLAGGLLLGAAVRAVYLLTPGLDSDMAIVGLMGRHILAGEFETFFWGQPFAGTLESYVAAVLFFAFGPSRLTLALSPFLFSLAFLVLTYRLGREVFDREVGLLALYLAAVPAPLLITHSVTARANYIENLVLGNLVLLLTLLVARETGAGRRRALVLLGLVAGLAWYESPQGVHYLATSGLFLVLHDRRLVLRSESWLIVPAFLLGSVPFWLYNLRTPAESTFVAIYNQAGGGDLPLSAFRYLAEKLPYVLGAVGRGAAVELSPSVLILLLYAAAFLHLVTRWRSPGARLALLFLLVTSTIVVVGFNQGGSIRYLLPLYSMLPIMMAALLARLRRRSVAAWAVACAGLLVSNLLATTTRADALDAGKRQLYQSTLARDDRLIEFLRNDGLTRVYVLDFWDAYRMTFDAQEEVVFAEPTPGFYPRYTESVNTAARYGYVIKGARTVPDFEDTLRSVGGSYRKRLVSGYTVIDNLVPPAGPPLRALSPAGWRGTPSRDGVDAAKAFDRDPFTSWRADPPEAPGTFYQLDLGQPRTIARVSVLPARPHEVPRAFQIQASMDGEHWETALALPETWRGLTWAGSRLVLEDTGRVQARFPPRSARWVRITRIRGASPSWSIRELFVSEVSPDPAPAARAPAVAAYRRGLELKRARDWAAAARAFQAAVDDDPDWDDGHVELTTAYEKLGIVQDQPYERGLALEGRGLADLAARHLWKAAQVFPHSHHTDPLLRLLRGNPAQPEAVRARLAAFAPAERVKARFGGRFELLGYTVERQEVAPGAQVKLSYFWKCLEEAPRDYMVFVHLRGDGIQFGDDHPPLDGRYPTSQWRKGETIRDDRLLRIPDDARPGPLTVLVGFWDPHSGKRLPADGPAVAPKGGGARLAPLVVTASRGATP